MNHDYMRGCQHAAELLEIKDGSLAGALYGTPGLAEVAQRLITQAQNQIADGVCPDHQRGVIDTAKRYIEREQRQHRSVKRSERNENRRATGSTGQP